MEKVKVGDVIPKTRVFSITSYSSVGTVEEFRIFTTEVCDYAESLQSGRISLDARKDNVGRVMQIDFIVEGGKVCDEVEAKFHNDMAEQDERVLMEKDKAILDEIRSRHPILFED